jgi:hypothetical protein
VNARAECHAHFVDGLVIELAFTPWLALVIDDVQTQLTQSRPVDRIQTDLADPHLCTRHAHTQAQAQTHRRTDADADARARARAHAHTHTHTHEHSESSSWPSGQPEGQPSGKHLATIWVVWCDAQPAERELLRVMSPHVRVPPIQHTTTSPRLIRRGKTSCCCAPPSLDLYHTHTHSSSTTTHSSAISARSALHRVGVHGIVHGLCER